MMALTLAGTTARTAAGAEIGLDDRTQLKLYARDTWRSIEAMVPPGALPFDGLRHRGGAWVPTGLTSPSNIAAYLWSAVAAAKLGLIGHDELSQRLEPMLDQLARLERCHGFYYNWYDPTTAARSHQWPGGSVLRPFLSSVDNGWLAAALMLVANVEPGLRDRAEAILAGMDFAFFYNPYDPSDPVAHPGLLRGGFWPDEARFTEFHYGTLNTEPRIASYVGIARRQIPPEHYFRMSRAAMATGTPARVRTYAGVPVAEASVEYRGLRLVPSWDGTMFEALMVSLFVPEAEWAPRSWGVNHPLYVQAQVEYGMREAKLGFWGISASSDPDGGYHAFGVPPIGSWSRLQPPATAPSAVVTPHASFLALRHAPAEAMANLRAMASRFPVYGPQGFLDAVDVHSGRVSECVLVLDQGMILAAIANALADDALVRGFCAGAVETVIRPLIAVEEFDASVDTVARERVSLAEAPEPAGVTTSMRKDDPEVPVIPAPHLRPVEPALTDERAPAAAAR